MIQKASFKMLKVGFGYDSHRFTQGDYVMIGAEKIPFNHGIEAHSDGDVLLHAICDALLGAAGLGDIGKHFPDNDQQYKNIDSSSLMKNVMTELKKLNYIVGNVDCTVILEKPKLAEHIRNMQKNISSLLDTSVRSVNIKATTNEGMGFIGRCEGIAAYAVVTLSQQN